MGNEVQLPWKGDEVGSFVFWTKGILPNSVYGRCGSTETIGERDNLFLLQGLEISNILVLN